jgi:hypothetical protein
MSLYSRDINIEMGGTDFMFGYRLGTMAGCCGIAILADLHDRQSEVTVGLSKREKRALAGKLGEAIAQIARQNDYGILMISTLAPESVVEDPRMAYYFDSENTHNQDFNLGTVARALKGRRGVTTRNPNTGNDITYYGVNLNEEV